MEREYLSVFGIYNNVTVCKMFDIAVELITVSTSFFENLCA